MINDDGQQLGVMPTDAARDIAGRIGMDLVEVSPNAQPPVCKIMDYGRYKYHQAKKAQEEGPMQVHRIRQIEAFLGDKEMTYKLVHDVAPRYAERNGGYTRILKMGPRQGDNAQMARIELV